MVQKMRLTKLLDQIGTGAYGVGCQCRRYIRKGGSPFCGYICSARMYPFSADLIFYIRRRKVPYLDNVPEEYSHIEWIEPQRRQKFGAP